MKNIKINKFKQDINGVKTEQINLCYNERKNLIIYKLNTTGRYKQLKVFKDLNLNNINQILLNYEFKNNYSLQQYSKWETKTVSKKFIRNLTKDLNNERKIQKFQTS